MTEKDLIAHCLALPDAVEDRPFTEGDYTVLRHESNRKWFALLFRLNGTLCANLKCEPMLANFLRTAYAGVRPAWHMNKVHWNTVEVDAVPEKELLEMILNSYELTAPRGKGRKGKPS